MRLSLLVANSKKFRSFMSRLQSIQCPTKTCKSNCNKAVNVLFIPTSNLEKLGENCEVLIILLQMCAHINCYVAKLRIAGIAEENAPKL